MVLFGVRNILVVVALKNNMKRSEKNNGQILSRGLQTTQSDVNWLS